MPDEHNDSVPLDPQEALRMMDDARSRLRTAIWALHGMHQDLSALTVDDLAANGLLGEADSQVCWKRSVETLCARKDDIEGLAVASDERIEACLLYVKNRTEEVEIVSLRSFIDDGGARLRQLFFHLRARGVETLRFPKVHPAEISDEWLQRLGFSPVGGHLLYAATLGQP